MSFILSCIFPELLHPFSIDIFEDYIYGVTYVNNIVFRVNKFGKGTMENLTTGINHATDIVLYHRYKQPESEWIHASILRHDEVSPSRHLRKGFSHILPHRRSTTEL